MIITTTCNAGSIGGGSLFLTTCIIQMVLAKDFNHTIFLQISNPVFSGNDMMSIHGGFWELERSTTWLVEPMNNGAMVDP